MNYALTMKNGNAEQKRAIYLLDQLEDKLTDTERQSVPDIARDIYQNNNTDLAHLTDTIGEAAITTLGALFPSDPLGREYTEDQIPPFKKKKKRKRRPPGI